VAVSIFARESNVDCGGAVACGNWPPLPSLLMPRANEITTPSEIPPIGTLERSTLDFKARPDTRGDAAYERAKDMAAFANALGGTILVGCADTSDRLTAYLPLAPADTTTTRRHYEEAARDLCVPAPVIVPHEIGWESGVIVAINVRPYPDRVIGVRKAGRPDVYTFPLRQMTRTIFLKPEQIAMYSDPRVRRALVLLRAIPAEPMVMLRTSLLTGGPQYRTVGDRRPSVLNEPFDGLFGRDERGTPSCVG